MSYAVLMSIAEIDPIDESAERWPALQEGWEKNEMVRDYESLIDLLCSTGGSRSPLAVWVSQMIGSSL